MSKRGELQTLGRAARDGWNLSRAVARGGGAVVRRPARFVSRKAANRMGFGAELASAALRESIHGVLRSGAASKKPQSAPRHKGGR
jgi:hypothetical protein